jgi:hypothetical protein
MLPNQDRRSRVEDARKQAAARPDFPGHGTFASGQLSMGSVWVVAKQSTLGVGKQCRGHNSASNASRIWSKARWSSRSSLILGARIANRNNGESSILELKAVEEPDPCHQQLTFQR